MNKQPNYESKDVERRSPNTIGFRYIDCFSDY